MNDQQKSYLAVAFDMDGTILNNDHKLTQETIIALRKLTTKAIVIIATGRSVPSICPYLKELNLNQNVVYCVGYNGSGIYKYEIDKNDNEMEFLASFPLSPDNVRCLSVLAEETHTVLQCYNAETGTVSVFPSNDEHEKLCERYEKLVGRRQTRISSYDEILGASSAKCLVLTNDPDSLIEKANATLPKDTFHIIKGSPWPFFVEFLPLNVSKGSALKVILEEHLGFGMDRLISFGDGDNDIEMLEQSGIGFAMLNANDNVKSSAKKVTRYTNDDNGVAKEIEELTLSGIFD